MTTFDILTTTWNFDGWVIVLCAILIISYVHTVRGHFSKSSLFFIAGVAVLFLTLVSPISMLGKSYLLSANMVQHITLLLIVPLLLLHGIPASTIENALKHDAFRKLASIIGRPIIAWFFGVGAMWIWHLPSLHSVVLRNENLYIFQQISFIVFGTIFWWPVFSPIEKYRLQPLISTLYLAAACLGCTILGIVITFASVGLYASYVNPIDSLGILSYIRNDLCLTPSVDQQIGGLMMWVPGCLIYLFASMLTIIRWFKSPGGDLISVNYAGSKEYASASITSDK